MCTQSRVASSQNIGQRMTFSGAQSSLSLSLSLSLFLHSLLPRVESVSTHCCQLSALTIEIITKPRVRIIRSNKINQIIIEALVVHFCSFAKPHRVSDIRARMRSARRLSTSLAARRIRVPSPPLYYPLLSDYLHSANSMSAPRLPDIKPAIHLPIYLFII